MIYDLLKEKILVLDGAMGTMIQKHTLSEEDYRENQFKNHSAPLKGNNDLLSITQPKIIEQIHREYLEAGADIIETNTFSSTTIAQADYKMESLVDEINYESARIAKKVVLEFTKRNPDRPRFVAGAIGPTNKTASISPDVEKPGYRAITFEELAKAYKQQAKALIEGGVDLLLIETIFDTLNAKAAIFGVEELKEEINSDIPIMISVTITDNSGRTLSGQTLEAFVISISHANILSIGLNCAFGASQLLPYSERLSSLTNHFTSIYPNAGLPNAFGEYDQTPDEMVDLIQPFFEKQILNIVGGCCGTTPNHIKKISDLANQFNPRKL